MEIVTLMGWIAVTVCFATTLSILCETSQREKNIQKLLKEIAGQLDRANEQMCMAESGTGGEGDLKFYNMRNGEWVDGTDISDDE